MNALGRWILAAVWLALAEGLSARADAPLLQQRDGAAELRITATVSHDAIVLTLIDTLPVTIEVEGDAALEVRPPDVWVKGPWQVRLSGPATRQENGQKTIWKQALHVEPQQPGHTSLLVAPLRYRGNDGEWQTATWKALPVRVTSRLTQAEVKNARDITSIEELPTPPQIQHQSVWILANALGVGVVAGLLLWWLRHRRLAKSRTTPEAWARYELQRLQALGLPNRGKHERFGTLLTGLLRRYLEKRFHLPARRQTTAEFLATLDGTAELADQRGFLEAWLRRCDLLKFAPVASSPDECRALAEQAAQFISQQETKPATRGA